MSAFQSGRYDTSGAVGISFATSFDGVTWSSGHLPNLTKGHGGAHDRVSDPSVAYSRKHKVWLISTLAFQQVDDHFEGVAILTSRSTDNGLTWSAPLVSAAREQPVDPENQIGLDKNWIVCDNSLASPFDGRCYVEFNDADRDNQIRMIRSSDGGTSWSLPVSPAGGPQGWGGQPVVQPTGVVVVPYKLFSGGVSAFQSRNGGHNWVDDVPVVETVKRDRKSSLNLRGFDQNFPSAEVDAAGWIYVVWAACSFRRSCDAGNDIVMSKSPDGKMWTSPFRVTFSSGDHVIPAIAADPDPARAGRLAVVYMRSTTPGCDGLACKFTYGYVSSISGGASWSANTTISPAMPLLWMPATSQGRMLGDYFSASIMFGRVFTVLPIARKKTVGIDNSFRQSMYVPFAPADIPARGLAVTGGSFH